MLNTFDKTSLHSLIKDFYSVVGIRISIFDNEYNVVTEYPVEAPSLCVLIRSSSSGLRACKACDRDACERAKTDASHVYKCHAGVTEAITPIRVAGSVAGYAIFAHMLPQDDYEKNIEEICAKCSAYGFSKNDILNSAKDLKTYSNEKIMASIRLLDAIASYLWVKRLASLKNEDISSQIRDYICKNLDKDLSSNTICKYFYMSRTKLYNVSQKAFGMGISEFITTQRIEKAKELLASGNCKISEVSNAVGIPDYNYFCKLFKRHTGISPGKVKV